MYDTFMQLKQNWAAQNLRLGRGLDIAILDNYTTVTRTTERTCQNFWRIKFIFFDIGTKLFELLKFRPKPPERHLLFSCHLLHAKQNTYFRQRCKYDVSKSLYEK